MLVITMLSVSVNIASSEKCFADSYGQGFCLEDNYNKGKVPTSAKDDEVLHVDVFIHLNNIRLASRNLSSPLITTLTIVGTSTF